MEILDMLLILYVIQQIMLYQMQHEIAWQRHFYFLSFLLKQMGINEKFSF